MITVDGKIGDDYPLMTFTRSVNMKSTLDFEVIPQNDVLMTLIEEEG